MKKIGNETPASATVIAARSKIDPRFSADSTPIATPDTSHRIEAPAASDSVTGIRSSSSGQTDCLVMNE